MIIFVLLKNFSKSQQMLMQLQKCLQNLKA